MDALNDFINFKIVTIGENTIQVYNILLVITFFILTRLAVWLVSKIIHKRTDASNQSNIYALAQISSYVIWVIGIVLILEALEIKVTFLLAGSAALLVGVGLGLQQTFNDFISGLILLFEGTTKVGDILEVDGDIVRIESIGLRTSKAINRFQISVIIPNSLITTNKVVNWSHHGTTTLFTVKVGVAYGSDVEQVMKILKNCATEHPNVVKKHNVDIRFTDFGSSSLDFAILFYTENIFVVEQIKSDIRINIAKAFKEHNISVPFNQLDVHIKNQE